MPFAYMWFNWIHITAQWDQFCHSFFFFFFFFFRAHLEEGWGTTSLSHWYGLIMTCVTPKKIEKSLHLSFSMLFWPRGPYVMYRIRGASSILDPWMSPCSRTPASWIRWTWHEFEMDCTLKSGQRWLFRSPWTYLFQEIQWIYTFINSNFSQIIPKCWLYRECA